MAAMLRFPLLLLQIKLALLLGQLLLLADLLSLRFPLLPLHLQRLLGFCADTWGLQLLSGIALPAFWIVRRLLHPGFDRRTELQVIVVF